MLKLKPIRSFRINSEETGEILVETPLFKVIVLCTQTRMLKGEEYFTCVFEDDSTCTLKIEDITYHPDFMVPGQNNKAQGFKSGDSFVMDVYPSKDAFFDTITEALGIEPHSGETIVSFISPDKHSYLNLKNEMAVVGINAEVVRVFERNTEEDKLLMNPSLSVEMRVDCEYTLLKKLIETSKLTKVFKKTLRNTTIEENPHVFQ